MTLGGPGAGPRAPSQAACNAHSRAPPCLQCSAAMQGRLAQVQALAADDGGGLSACILVCIASLPNV
eukprot:CAMPEP_0179137086 /NCGR_PEP_ID=MMETSP0796-20121207/65375_1 /TAXON_ID=73915 /ORGANISM="Pyrodinium bahamense, Strain pbaha01" /LENGTH=66 /DNA_ID=CAMNT_0020836239 /DNA_START=62 /DNA_END=259 /DNA_ORIENTATION=-